MAYQLRELVNRHIEDKHLGTAYASASETACTLTQPQPQPQAPSPSPKPEPNPETLRPRDPETQRPRDPHLDPTQARTGSGDCTEHAVLLAALLKARMIPSRVCHGLVYVELGGSAINGQAEVDAEGNVIDSAASGDGQFGWHMWSQALINGHWHDLDATLHVPYTVGPRAPNPNPSRPLTLTRYPDPDH